MSLPADRKSARSHTGSITRLMLLAMACALNGAVLLAEDEVASKDSRASTAAIRLPPRNVSDSTGSRKTSSSNSGLWTSVLSLTAIVATLGLVGYFAKPYLGGPRGLPLEAFELLGRRAIEQKISVHLIRCGRRVLVVGISPEGARTLSEITDPGEVQHLVDTCRAPQEHRPISPLVPPFGSSKNSRPADFEPPVARNSLSHATSLAEDRRRE